MVLCISLVFYIYVILFYFPDAQLKEMMSEPVKNKLFNDTSAKFKIDKTVVLSDMPQESFRRLNIDWSPHLVPSIYIKYPIYDHSI